MIRSVVLWLLASALAGIGRMLTVWGLGVWTAAGTLAVSPEAYALIHTVQIAFTGTLYLVLQNSRMGRRATG